MAQELGTGYILIQPSTKGLGKSIEGSIEQATTSGTTKSSKSILSGIGGAFSKVGKIGVGAVATVTGAVVGLAAKGGFERALNIERAQTKLKALGHDTQSIDSIMNSALASVKGTAYGLGDAASVAAQLVASGIEQGEGLERALTLVGDAASIAGVEFTDMGTIFSKVAATGHLQGDEMNQLMEAGIPILQDLAKHYGITAEEARDMVSDGKVSFEDFSAAMEEHFGGAAKRAGDSFDGAMANIKAALSRVGEGFGTPLIKGATRLANQLIPVVDQIANAFKPLQSQFENVFNKIVDEASRHIEDFSQKLENGEITIEDIGKKISLLAGGFATLATVGGHIDPLIDGLNTMSDTFNDVTNHAKNGLSKLPATISSNLDSARNTFTRFQGLFDKDIRELLVVDGDTFATAAQRVANGMDGIGNQFKNGIEKLSNTKLGTAVSNIFDSMRSGITFGVEKVKYEISNAMHGISNTIGNNPVVNAAKTMGDKIAAGFSEISGKVKDALAPVGEVLGGIGDMIGPKLQSGLSSIGSMISQFFSPGNFMKFVGIGAIIAALVAGLGAINEATGGQLEAFASNMLTYLSGAINQAMSFIQGQLPGLVESGGQIILSIVQGVTTSIPSLVTVAGQAVNTLVTGLANALPQLIPAGVEMITTLVTSLLDQIPQLIDAGMSLLEGLVDGAVQAIPTLIAAIPQIIDSLITGLMSSLPRILESGTKIIKTLTEGITSAIPQLVAMLPQVITTIVTGITQNLPAIIQAGLDLILALVDGITSALPELAKALPQIIQAVVQAIVDNLPMLIVAGLQIIIALASALVQAIPSLIMAIPQIVQALIDGFMQTDWLQLGMDLLSAIGEGLTAAQGILSELWTDIWTSIKDTTSDLWDGISSTVSDKWNEMSTQLGTEFEEMKSDLAQGWETVKSTCSSAWDSIKSNVSNKWNETRNAVSNGLSNLKSSWDSDWQTVKSKCSDAWNTIKSGCSNGINSAKTTISNGLNNVKSSWSSGWESMKSKMSSVWSGIQSGASQGISAVMSTVSSIKGKITGFFSGAGSWLVSSGRSILEGLKNGIMSAISSVTSAVSSAVSKIRDLFPFSPAKTGPFSGKGWVLYSGMSIMDAMADGITRETGTAVKSMRESMRTLHSQVSTDMPLGFNLDPIEQINDLASSRTWDLRGFEVQQTNYYLQVDNDMVAADTRVSVLLEQLVDACGVSLKARA